MNLLMLAAVAATMTNEWPLVAVRLTGHVEETPAVFERQIALHAQHRGSCDEYWFGSGACGAKLDLAAKRLQSVGEWRRLLDPVGIRLSYQQGVTLGHGYPLVQDDVNAVVAAACFTRDEFHPFPDDTWMVDEEERHLKELRMCPRSPAARDYLYRYVKLAVGTIRPSSYWLDDDLRLGFCTLQGCFCDRCLEAFNVQHGTAYTRRALIEALNKGKLHDPLRVQWSDFNQEALAGFAAEARRAVDEVMPACRLCLQMVRPDMTWSGRDWRRVYAALAGKDRHPVGVRVGSDLCYNEADPGLFVWRTFRMAEEAERTKAYGGLVGTICYEEETYPRRALHKSPGAIVVECALALASGADTLSLYFYDGRNPEPLTEYARFAKTVAQARPYFERLSVTSRRTRLGGVARVVGRHAAKRRGFCTSDDTDVRLSRFGIPVTVAAAEQNVHYLSKRSVEDMDEDEIPALVQGGLLMSDVVWQAFSARFPEVAKSVRARIALVPEMKGPTSDYPLFSERTAFLDALDRMTPGGACVRIEEARMIHPLARVNGRGRTEALTLFNCSLGTTDELILRIRRPVGSTAVWVKPDGSATPLETTNGPGTDEVTIRHPGIAPWSLGTLFLSAR